MTREEALYKVKGYLTDIIPAEDYSEVEEIIKALEQEPITKNDSEVDYTIDSLDDFIEFGKKAFGVELAIKKSDNPDIYEKFAEWVASEIMPEIEWVNNQNAFPELACRRLEKLGIVREENGMWVRTYGEGDSE